MYQKICIFSFFSCLSHQKLEIHSEIFFQKVSPKNLIDKKHSVNQLKKRLPSFLLVGFYYPKEEPEFLNDLYQLEQEIRDKRRTEGALRFVRRNDNSFDELMLSKKLLKRDLLKRLLMNTRKQ